MRQLTAFLFIAVCSSQSTFSRQKICSFKPSKLFKSIKLFQSQYYTLPVPEMLSAPLSKTCCHKSDLMEVLKISPLSSKEYFMKVNHQVHVSGQILNSDFTVVIWCMYLCVSEPRERSRRTPPPTRTRRASRRSPRSPTPRHSALHCPWRYPWCDSSQISSCWRKTSESCRSKYWRTSMFNLIRNIS